MRKMKDYIDKLNSEDESLSVVEEPALAMDVHQTAMSTDRHMGAIHLLEDSMPCFFSEEELDEEIQVSMRSGNATQKEIDAVFCR